MKKRSRSLKELQEYLKETMSLTQDKYLLDELSYLYRLSQDTESEYDDIIREAEMRGIRNPSFPDDLVGWLDDDFTYPDDDDDENDKND